MEDTTKQKHTAGPWKFDSSDMNIYSGNGSGICTVHRRAKVVGVDDLEKSGPSIETKANALVLESAPELLEALEKLYFSVYGGNSVSLEDCLYRSVKSDEFEQSIVVAIKKAKGL